MALPFNLNPEMLAAVSQGLLSGRTGSEQLGNAMTGALQARQGMQQRNKTVEFLAQSPEISQMVEAGVLSPQDGLKAYLAQQAETRKAQAPNRKFQTLTDGTYGFADETAGTFTPMGRAAKANDYKPTSLMMELEAAGLQPGSPEYQRAILEANKPKGMMLESDGQGGFRMVQGSNIDGMPSLNVEQGKNTGFLLRAQDSDKIITKFEDEGTSTWNKAMSGLPGGLGNHAISSEAQQLGQAKRDFINAVLRQESGAVISPEEFANAEQQYFPQPGDGPEVIAQKRANRENAIAGFRIRSGPGSGVADRAQQPQGGVVDYTDYFK